MRWVMLMASVDEANMGDRAVKLVHGTYEAHETVECAADGAVSGWRLQGKG